MLALIGLGWPGLGWPGLGWARLGLALLKIETRTTTNPTNKFLRPLAVKKNMSCLISDNKLLSFKLFWTKR